MFSNKFNSSSNNNNNENKLVLLPYSSGANRIRNETITTNAAATGSTIRVVSNNSNNNSSLVVDPQQFGNHHHHVSVLCCGEDHFGSNSNNQYWNRSENIGCSNNNSNNGTTNLIPEPQVIVQDCCRSGIIKKRPRLISSDNRIRISKKPGRRKVEKRVVQDSNDNYCYNNGAFQGLVAEAVVGTTDANGQVLHLVKWEGRDELEFVPAIFTTIKFPHVVLAFYQNRMDLSNNNNSHSHNHGGGVVAISNI